MMPECKKDGTIDKTAGVVVGPPFPTQFEAFRYLRVARKTFSKLQTLGLAERIAGTNAAIEDYVVYSDFNAEEVY